MDFYIRPRGKGAFVVEDGAGARHTAALPLEAATAKLKVLQQAERERVVNDPEVLNRRREKAAYRRLERDPVLQLVRKLAKKAKRNTQESYDQMMHGKAPPELKAINEQRVKDGLAPYPVFSFEKCMSIQSSDPQVHAELNRTAGQRRTRKATTAHGQVGASTMEQVVALKKKGLRQVAIAKQLDISPEWVSRILKKAKAADLKS